MRVRGFGSGSGAAEDRCVRVTTGRASLSGAGQELESSHDQAATRPTTKDARAGCFFSAHLDLESVGGLSGIPIQISCIFLIQHPEQSSKAKRLRQALHQSWPSTLHPTLLLSTSRHDRHFALRILFPDTAPLHPFMYSTLDRRAQNQAGLAGPSRSVASQRRRYQMARKRAASCFLDWIPAIAGGVE